MMPNFVAQRIRDSIRRKDSSHYGWAHFRLGVAIALSLSTLLGSALSTKASEAFRLSTEKAAGAKDAAIGSDLTRFLAHQMESQIATTIPEEGELNPLDHLRPLPNSLTIQTDSEAVAVTEIQPITLDEAIELAYRNNPDLPIALLELEQSGAQLQEARAIKLPRVTKTTTLTLIDSRLMLP